MVGLLRLRRRTFFWLIPLALLAVLAACEAAGWAFLRVPAENLLARRLERPVRLEPPFRLGLFGAIDVRLGGLWIAAPEGFAAPHLATARDLEIRLRYRDLPDILGERSLPIAHLGATTLDIQLLRQADGKATWQFRTAEDKDAAGPVLPTVASLRIGESRLVFRDPISKSDLVAGFTAGSAAGDASRIRAEARGKLLGEPVKLDVDATGWLPSSPGQEADLPLRGRVALAYGKGGIEADFEGRIADPLGKRQIEGAVEAKGSSLGIVGELIDKPIPTTGPFSIAGRFSGSGDTWRIDVGAARVGSSFLNGRFSLDLAPSPPRVEGELGGKRFVLADLAPALGTRRPDGTPIEPAGGAILPDRPLHLSRLKNLDARVKVEIERVDLGALFAEPISPLKGVLMLRQGQLALNDLDAVTARGRLRGRITIDARSNPPDWRAGLAWDGIRLEDWLRPPGPRDPKGLPEPDSFIAGALNGRASLNGSGDTTADLLASLNGQVTSFVRAGKLSHLAVEAVGLDLAQGLGLALSGDDALPIDCAVVDLKVRAGVLTPEVAMLDTPVTLILGKGAIDLGRERLDLRIVARPKNASPLTLRSPINIRGSFADPAVIPDPAPIAARVLGGLALAVINPLAAIIPFVDPGEGQGSPCRRSLEELKR